MSGYLTHNLFYLHKNRVSLLKDPLLLLLLIVDYALRAPQQKKLCIIMVMYHLHFAPISIIFTFVSIGISYFHYAYKQDKSTRSENIR